MKTARLAKRRPGNAPGKYFTTAECDGCAYCASVAPENFDYDKGSNSYIVTRQPRDKTEEELMIEALEDCPLDAIGATADEPIFAR